MFPQYPVKASVFAVWLLSCAVVTPAVAVEQSQLWLPRSEYRHFNSLYRAAEVAEQTQRCRYVIAGSLNRSRSRDDHPVFTITCRDANRQTFAWVVDGNSQEILNRPEPEVKDPEVVKREQAQQQLASQWQLCFRQLAQRTAGLRQVQGFSDAPPEQAAQSAAATTFAVDFSARGRSSKALHYQAQCEVSQQQAHLTIRPLKNTTLSSTQASTDSTADAAADKAPVDG